MGEIIRKKQRKYNQGACFAGKTVSAANLDIEVGFVRPFFPDFEKKGIFRDESGAPGRSHP